MGIFQVIDLAGGDIGWQQEKEKHHSDIKMIDMCKYLIEYVKEVGLVKNF